ncbi:MAG: FprA family A-type flavoprotein [Prevotellaceae bacterium]|jgi:flavorubredoxin|nr:FprA family A-type flavoprotein [Prevotellaceae bacterium]
MFKNQAITSDIFYVGVNDRQKAKFENLIPLSRGVSYNSYLIIDEKTALVDTVDISFGMLFIHKVLAALNGKTLDYLIINHMEPDHSGAIGLLRKYFPQMTIVGNAKTLSMVEGFHGSVGNSLEIKEKDTLNLGQHVLQFYMIPMVHWPETMVTYDATARVLFSGDAFGSFGTLDGAIIDVQMNVKRFWNEMIRYYANIVGKYGSPVQKALDKIVPLPIDFICSTHGPVWTENIPQVIDIYADMANFRACEGVVIVYGTMYGNTEQMAEAVARGVAEAGVKHVLVYNASVADSSVILRDIYKYKGLIAGSPTYNNELYPEIESLLRKLEIRGVRNRVFGYFGSYSWAGAAVKRIKDFAEKMDFTLAETVVEQKQALNAENYEKCVKLGKEVGEKVKSEDINSRN